MSSALVTEFYLDLGGCPRILGHCLGAALNFKRDYSI